MSEKDKMNRFIDFIMGSEQDFYDTYLVDLSEEEMEQFLKNNPDFMERMKREQE